jgi:hypothetical protein
MPCYHVTVIMVSCYRYHVFMITVSCCHDEVIILSWQRYHDNVFMLSLCRYCVIMITRYHIFFLKTSHTGDNAVQYLRQSQKIHGISLLITMTLALVSGGHSYQQRNILIFWDSFETLGWVDVGSVARVPLNVTKKLTFFCEKLKKVTNYHVFGISFFLFILSLR